jgi:hypothetical protein
MSRRVPIWVTVFLVIGVALACAHGLAAEGNPAGASQQPEHFAEEIRQLEAAGDSAARRNAFGAILKRAEALETEPEPLLSILRNRRPEAAFEDLLDYVRDNPDARKACFVAPLAVLANEAGDNAGKAGKALHAYGTAAAPELVAMLHSDRARERVAAASAAGRRIGGMAGALHMVRPLVQVLQDADAELAGVVVRSLRELTLLRHETPEQWAEWIGDRTEHELLIEIADREAEARRLVEAERKKIEAELLEVLIERIRREQSTDVDALVRLLTESQFLMVRSEAVELLKPLLATLEEEHAAAVIKALGQVLLDPAEDAGLRRRTAATLADSGRPSLAFPFIDQALQSNGLNADLRLELVRGLNSPLAARRLALMLEAEVEGVVQRSSALLEQLVAQVRAVVDFEDTSDAAGQILAQLDRLLGAVLQGLDGDLERPARERLVDLAVRTCDVLVHVARLRRVDISMFSASLVSLASSDTSAASAAVTTLRQALQVPAGRDAVREDLTSELTAPALSALYSRLMAGSSESLLVNLLGLFEELPYAPEPLDVMQVRLLERAENSAATLPTRPEARRTVRDGLRGVLAAMLETEAEHVNLLRALLDARHGEMDALGYLRVLPPPRTDIMTASLRPLIAHNPLRVGCVLAGLSEWLTPAERESDEYRALVAESDSAVKAAFEQQLGRVIAEPTEEHLAAQAGHAAGPMRGQWIRAALACLRNHADPTEGRDAVAERLTEALQQAYPDDFQDLELKGDREAFLATLEATVQKLNERE